MWDDSKQALKSVGFFIPPYISLLCLGKLKKCITDSEDTFGQEDLEELLAQIYSPEYLAAMVTKRYPETRYIQDYKVIIAEAVQAHFLGLDHVAVAGLMPVIEGAGKKLAESRGIVITAKSNTNIFDELMLGYKKEVEEKRIGSVSEILAMLDSFVVFIRQHFYVFSDRYSLSDKTNRHGILHGAYADDDYGKPINFYKSIAAVDFLCFLYSIHGGISFFAPDPTEESKYLAMSYHAKVLFSRNNEKLLELLNLKTSDKS